MTGTGQGFGGVPAEARAGTGDEDYLGHDQFPSNSDGLGASEQCGESLLRKLAGEEVADNCRDLRSLAFQREMAGIEQVYFSVRVIAFEGLGAGRQEKRIVLAPDGE